MDAALLNKSAYAFAHQVKQRAALLHFNRRRPSELSIGPSLEATLLRSLPHAVVSRLALQLFFV
jgi:hypothetical protein